MDRLNVSSAAIRRSSVGGVYRSSTRVDEWPEIVSEVRSFREQDMLRFWPGVLRIAVVVAVVRNGRRSGVSSMC